MRPAISATTGNSATRPPSTRPSRKAAHVTKLELVNKRLVPNAIEPRSALGEYDSATGDYTLYTSSQNPHVIRLLMCAFVLASARAQGARGGARCRRRLRLEDLPLCRRGRASPGRAKKVGRPIKWTSDRSEAFLTDAQGRDHVTEAELALDKDGKFLALKVKTVANMGAYLSTFASAVPTYLYGTLLAGQYTTPAIYVEVKAVFTNTVPVDAYRGAGRPEATYLLERIVEQAAREMKIDPAELRRRNLIAADQLPLPDAGRR